MATAVAVPAAIATAVIVASLASPADPSDADDGGRPPATAAVTVAPPGGDPAAAAACADLMAALPDHVADQAARTVVSDSTDVRAWGDPPIVLRCGVPAPAGFAAGSPTLVVNGVEWYVDEADPDQRTWTTVDRAGVYVEVAVPAAEPGSTFIADLATTIAKKLPPA